MQTEAERKVVEVFKTFFEKMVFPSIRNQPQIIEEWKYLTSIVQENPLVHSKLEVYMTMLNHDKVPTNNLSQKLTSSSHLGSSIHSKKEYLDNSIREYRNQKQGQQEGRKSPRKGPDMKDSKLQEQKKKLLLSLEHFHSSLVDNQQKLESDFRRDRLKEVEERRFV